jgi:hypothetical protein
VLTRADYACFIRQFGEIFTEEINLAKIVNTSLKGAYIKGMEYVALFDEIKNLSGIKPDINNIISEMYSQSKENWDKHLSSVILRLRQSLKDMEVINKQSDELYRDLEKVCSVLKSEGKTDYSSEAFVELAAKIVELRQSIIKDVFMSNSLQEAIWTYTRKYITKSLPSKEDLIFNLELDRDFFKLTNEESSIIINNLSETLSMVEVKCHSL